MAGVSKLQRSLRDRGLLSDHGCGSAIWYDLGPLLRVSGVGWSPETTPIAVGGADEQDLRPEPQDLDRQSQDLDRIWNPNPDTPRKASPSEAKEHPMPPTQQSDFDDRCRACHAWEPADHVRAAGLPIAVQASVGASIA